MNNSSSPNMSRPWFDLKELEELEEFLNETQEEDEEKQRQFQALKRTNPEQYRIQCAVFNRRFRGNKNRQEDSGSQSAPVTSSTMQVVDEQNSRAEGPPILRTSQRTAGNKRPNSKNVDLQSGLFGNQTPKSPPGTRAVKLPSRGGRNAASKSTLVSQSSETSSNISPLSEPERLRNANYEVRAEDWVSEGESPADYPMDNQRQIDTWIYKTILKSLEPLIVPAILNNDPSIIRSMSLRLDSARGITKSPLETLLQELDSTLTFYRSYTHDPQVIQLVFRDLFSHIRAGVLNNLLENKEFCKSSKATHIRFNVSQLKEWCRKRKMTPDTLENLQPIIQATQLIKAKKTEDNVGSLCELCDTLTVHEVVKLLWKMPAEEFDERQVSVIRSVERRLEETRRSSETHSGKI